MAILGSVLMLLSKTAMSFEMIMAGRFFFGINSGNLLSKLTGASFLAVQTVTSLNLVRLCMWVLLIFPVTLGASLSVYPMYVMEITPRKLKGIVGVSIGSFLSLGKFSGQLLGIR